MAVVFIYFMRRVNCPDCGIRVEQVPWADGKSPVTHELKWFLAKWAKMMSWKEVASDFSGSDQTGPPKLCFGSSDFWVRIAQSNCSLFAAICGKAT